MKKTIWNKFKNSYTRLVLLSVVSLGAGLGLLIAPEKTSLWIIKGVGFIWTLEGISYAFDVYLKYLKSKEP